MGLHEWYPKEGSGSGILPPNRVRVSFCFRLSSSSEQRPEVLYIRVATISSQLSTCVRMPNPEIREKLCRPWRLQPPRHTAQRRRQLPKAECRVAAGGSGHPGRRPAGDEVPTVLVVPAGERIRREGGLYPSPAGRSVPRGDAPPAASPRPPPVGAASAALQAALPELPSESAET